MATLAIEHGAKGVLRIEMARPEVRNAFDETMIAEIDAAFASAATNPTCAASFSPARGTPSPRARTSPG